MLPFLFFSSLVSTPIGITSSWIGLKKILITVKIKSNQSIIKKKKKKHDTITLLGKSKLNSIKVLNSMALIDWNVSHEEFVLIYNVLKDTMLFDTKVKIKNCNDK